MCRWTHDATHSCAFDPLTPLFPTHPSHPIPVSNVRILNGATMGNGAAMQISGAVKSVRFDWCDFMGNIATDGGAGAHSGLQHGGVPCRLVWERRIVVVWHALSVC